MADKNTHLTHLEDLVLLGGLGAVKRACDYLKSAVNMLTGESIGKFNITVKFDGAPAVVCGYNPENGKFFVGTKSVFAKSPKVMYSVRDINQNYTGELAQKLTVAFNELQTLDIPGIWQGDLLFTHDSVSTANIGGENCFVFRPNTISYAIPVNSELGKKVRSAKLGIAFHTSYTGNSLATLGASFGVNIRKLKKSSSVMVFDTNYRDLSGTAKLTAAEAGRLKVEIGKIERMASSLRSNIVDNLQSMGIIEPMQIYINSLVRQGRSPGTGSAAELAKFVLDKETTSIMSLSVPGAIDRRTQKRNDTINFIVNNSSAINILFSIMEAIISVKTMVVDKLNQIESVGTFLQNSDGSYRVTAPEGFVAIDHQGDAVKLVNRLEFSAANFSIPKNWVRESCTIWDVLEEII